MKIKVLHITPHISGGVGSVLLSILKFYNKNQYFEHEIIAFEKLLDSEKKFFKGFLKKITRTQNYQTILKKIKDSDIVQIEWWSHPLIYYFLITFPFPKCRLIICSHIAGFYRPNLITKNIVKFSDIFLATSKATSELSIFNNKRSNALNKKLKFIDYPINLERFDKLKKKKHNTFNIGYIGTLDYSKLYRNFLLISSKINIPKVKFIICGNDLGNNIYKESLLFKKTKFEFKGFVNNLNKVFEELDLFGYPLNPKHFGTGEQILKESMFAALPIVAFDNPCERNIIKNGVTGILVKKENQYIQAIEALYKDKKKRIKLGRNAKNYIIKNLSPNKNFNNLNLIYKDLLKKQKKSKSFNFSNIKFNNNIKKDIGVKIFIESLGHKSDEFYNSYTSNNNQVINKANLKISKCEKELRVKNKGSIFQYLRYFSNDRYLNFWAGIIKQQEGKYKNANKYFKLSKFNKARIDFIIKKIL